MLYDVLCLFFFFFQAKGGIRGPVGSRGLGEGYKGQKHEIGTRIGQMPGNGQAHTIGSACDNGRFTGD